ncbi:hypothetical protein V1477_008648 [Vespula maculifrons]|uniref:Uncharacterized protein n=1 Tax=Vespula maculifrons TaxID=7453 RepID=A0ABD2CEK7_VESMC
MHNAFLTDFNVTDKVPLSTNSITELANAIQTHRLITSFQAESFALTRAVPSSFKIEKSRGKRRLESDVSTFQQRQVDVCLLYEYSTS